MTRDSLLARLRAALRDRGPRQAARAVEDEGIIELCEALVSTRGEASGVALATVVLDRYSQLALAARRGFFTDLVTHFDPDADLVTVAAERFAADRSPEALAALNAAAEPPRQELFRRLNQAPGATAALVRMRADLLDHLRDEPDLRRVDADFRHLLSSWFNRGFLVMEPITWGTPADVLEKIIDYEAVHEIADWTELRRRLRPDDRRCYAFFHPAMPGDPLVFVEVALTRGTPDSLTGLLSDEREPLAGTDADTAVFYSISNCQAGLRGVSFGHFLIKQVASELARDLPDLTTFVTLSPVPGLAAWVEARADAGHRAAGELLDLVKRARWGDDPGSLARHAELITPLGASYLLSAKRADGAPLDPVARFHLGNGAVLERINPQANLTPTGMTRSLGLMVNYRYDLDRIEENHEAYATHREVNTTRAVHDAAGIAEAPDPARAR